MRNPEVTKDKILKQSGDLFNTQGYKATSLSDITNATGFTKGAIYRHFKSKSILEQEALSYLSEKMFTELRQRIKNEDHAPAKLRAIFNYFNDHLLAPKIKGGCPLMNVAIEADDCHPDLKHRAQVIMDDLQSAVIHILEKGKKYGQIKPYADSRAISTVIIAGLEGAIMMSKLRGQNDDIKIVTYFLEQILYDISI